MSLPIFSAGSLGTAVVGPPKKQWVGNVLSAGTPSAVSGTYAGFAFVGFGVYHVVADGDASSVLTLSALAQLLAVSLLCIQVLMTHSAAGISAGSLLLDAMAICFRLSSTLWLDGYLPSDRSGDFVYQCFDLATLLLIIYLLHRMLVVHIDTYQATEDSCPIGVMLIISLALATLLHGNMDNNPLFDTLWMAGLFTSVVAVLPQLWLIISSGGWAGSLASHYIATMALSRLLSGLFMWMARNFITCDHFRYLDGIEHAIYAILAAHVLHAVFLCDFFYHYMRTVIRNGLSSSIRLCPGEV